MMCLTFDHQSFVLQTYGATSHYFAELAHMRCAIERVVYSDERIEWLQQAGVVRRFALSRAKCARETFHIYRSMA